ncbi:hypothetical protein QN092_21300 (plasmid) [Proteus vulgaris]|uniref:hypothetical protein n=1 Tax=Proteus vulgaris TaxID=585 RepID=UPI00253F9BB6|nr:hypothetical protein [Proteus vulgaris]WIF74499.1 hypothetical protein QN092_21300 [Proteus vulgaris]
MLTEFKKNKLNELMFGNYVCFSRPRTGKTIKMNKLPFNSVKRITTMDVGDSYAK